MEGNNRVGRKRLQDRRLNKDNKKMFTLSSLKEDEAQIWIIIILLSQEEDTERRGSCGKELLLSQIERHYYVNILNGYITGSLLHFS